MLRDAFIAAVASQIVAAPSTYKIATLDGADKLTSSQDPSQSVSYLGGHDMVANSPALADGTGTAGDTYYVTNPGTRNYGSGNITAQEGDALVYSGSVWQLVEGIANILDGISTASTARTTLSVNSIDEDAEATGTKLVGPALYFDGSNDYLEVADDAKLSFTDGTDDLPFSVSAWVKPDSNVQFIPLSKYNASGSREFILYSAGSGNMKLYLCDSTDTNRVVVTMDTGLTTGQWQHLCVTYGGSGPNSSSAFSSAQNEITFYLNGEAIGTTAVNTAYAGMSNTAQAVWIGRQGSSYAKGHIRNVQIFNRELTTSEVAQLARGNDLGFADEWGGALGGVYTQDATPSGEWTATNGTDADEAGPIGGRSNVLKLTVDATTGEHSLLSPQNLAVGKKYRIEFDYYMPSTNSDMDGLRVRMQSSATDFVYQNDTATQDAWTRVSIEAVGSGNQRFWISGSGGGSFNFTDAGGDDVLYIDGLTVTEIGTLADFRAEDFNESAGKLLDRSTNNFVGVNNGATLVGARRHISADTIDLKNLPTSSAGLSAGEVWSNGGVLTVV
jgi:hypothetical protein